MVERVIQSIARAKVGFPSKKLYNRRNTALDREGTKDPHIGKQEDGILRGRDERASRRGPQALRGDRDIKGNRQVLMGYITGGASGPLASE